MPLEQSPEQREVITEVSISLATPHDTSEYCALRRQIDTETKFMLGEPGERAWEEDKTTQAIEDLNQSGNSTIILARVENQVVGFLQLAGGKLQRQRKTAEVIIGILEEFTNKGIGKKLFTEMEHWARAHNLHRLELGVMTNNDRGIHLYQQMGFQQEGIRKEAYLIDNKFVDSIMMAKILDSQ